MENFTLFIKKNKISKKIDCFFGEHLLPFNNKPVVIVEAEKTAIILFYMDMKGVAVSRGSACQSGSNKPSHVLGEMLSDEELTKPSLRISFSHNNTKADIDYLIKVLQEI